jgi:hypothetical protein
MRTPQELWFRLKQEVVNAAMFALPPSVSIAPPESPLPGLPDPARVIPFVKGTLFEQQLIEVADAALAHRFPLLGIELETGPDIRWRRDYSRGVETGTDYFRRIPYLDAERAGDQKLIWELNRHQHLVALAQAWLCTGRTEYALELSAQIDNWMEENPFQRGINWASALEVAYRALSWIWIYHFAASCLNRDTRQRFLTVLYQHGLHLEHNLSVYFSPNTHLLGEAVVLHALGKLFPSFPGADRWHRTGLEIVRSQMAFQVQADGSHFEQSSYYHVYAVDLFLLHAILEPVPAGYQAKLLQMAEYLKALAGTSQRLPFLGDDDGGRVFHPYGDRSLFARGTLATCAVFLPQFTSCYSQADLLQQAVWWLGPDAIAATRSPCRPRMSSLFPNAGVAVMEHRNTQVIVDAGSFGVGSGGHSHSDSLSIIARDGDSFALIDPGTYTYVGDLHWRNWFRGSAAHNTIRIDGRDQAVPVNPFRWGNKPAVQVLEWKPGQKADYLDAACEFAAFRHRRRVFFLKPELVIILDELTGAAGPEHTLEQFWHLGMPGADLGPFVWRVGDQCTLAVSKDAIGNGSVVPVTATMSLGGENGWASPVYASKVEAPVLNIQCMAAFPLILATSLTFTAVPQPVSIKVDGVSTVVTAQSIALSFPAEGPPVQL